MKTIEILIATYNGGKYLEEQLQSIIKQTYKNWKIIIRDDGSSDNTLDIVNQYQTIYGDQIVLLKDNKNRLGSTLSFAALLEASTEEYIMLCDQDDYWLENKIALTYNRMLTLESENPTIPLMVFTDLKEVDENLNPLAESFMVSQKLYPSICNNATNLLALNVVAGCTTMINKTAKKVIVPIPSGIIHDQWMAINIAYYGKVSFLPVSTILYRQHTNNYVGSNMVGFKYFVSKISMPAKQFKIYYTLISNLNFNVNIMKFVYMKFFFTVKRLFKYDKSLSAI